MNNVEISVVYQNNSSFLTYFSVTICFQFSALPRLVPQWFKPFPSCCSTILESFGSCAKQIRRGEESKESTLNTPPSPRSEDHDSSSHFINLDESHDPTSVHNGWKYMVFLCAQGRNGIGQWTQLHCLCTICLISWAQLDLGGGGTLPWVDREV